ncbi:MAG: metallophosphoesterase [Hyphomicrobiales bacterium]|nr:metallophosphoesterase [Hyphomicrobiales bacterium]
MSVFRIIHVSDLHFSSRENRFRVFGQHNATSVQLAAEFILAQNDVDALIASGDIAETGSRNCLTEALRFFSGPSSKIRKHLTESGTGTIADFQGKIIIMPGNHDRFHALDRMPGCEEFDAVFNNYWPPSERVHIVRISSNNSEKLGLAVICVDFSLRGPDECPGRGVWGQGLVHMDVLEILERETIKTKKNHPADAVIWAVHFPPCQIEFDPFLQLIAYEDLTRCAEKNNIKYILSGHIHRRAVYKTGSTSIICAGSMSRAGEENWIHKLEFKIDSGELHMTKKEDYKYDVFGNSFRPVT